MNRISWIWVCIIGMGLLACTHSIPESTAREVMTVTGPIPVEKMGTTLIHEHVFLDWSGADSIDASRWDQAGAFDKIAPFLIEAKQQGVHTFLECTPAYLGRNPELLKKLSRYTGLNMLTNTGYYGARNNQFIPTHVLNWTVDQLRNQWVQEFRVGIGQSGIKPGFIKISVDRDSLLSDIHERLVRAAAQTHLETGLAIVSHTGPDAPAFAQLALLEEEGVAPDAFVWTHAQRGSSEGHIQAAQRGAWISLDNVKVGTSRSDKDEIQRYIDFLINLKRNNLLGRTLISHDAGWYTVGKSEDAYRGYTAIFTDLIPRLLEEHSFTQDDIRQLLVENPGEAYALRVRRRR